MFPAAAVDGLEIVHAVENWDTIFHVHAVGKIASSDLAGTMLVARSGGIFFQSDPFALKSTSRLLVVGKAPATQLALGPVALFQQLLASADKLPAEPPAALPAELLNWVAGAATENKVQLASPASVAGKILTLNSDMDDVEINMFNDVVNESGEPYAVLCHYQQHRLVSDTLSALPAINSPKTSHKISPKTGKRLEHTFSGDWQEYARTQCSSANSEWTPDGAAKARRLHYR
jgi:hypothetical protein